MAQMCGATAIKYYLPTVFLALGLSKDMSLMASGIESTLKIGLTIMEMFLVDIIGRRNSLLIGAVVASVAMLVCFVDRGRWRVTTKLTDDRSMAPYLWRTRITRIMLRTTLVLCSSSSSPSAIPLDSAQMRGYMGQRYGRESNLPNTRN